MATGYVQSRAIEQKWLAGIAAVEDGPTKRLVATYKKSLRQLENEAKPLIARLKKADGDDAAALNTRLLLIASRAQSMKDAAMKAVAGSALEAETKAELAGIAQKAYKLGAATSYGKLKGVGVAFDRVNDDQLKRFLARLQPGTVANEWVRKMSGDAGTALVGAMSRGVALGYGPEQITREVRGALEASTARVRTFVRTEVVGAARAGSLDSYRRNAGVVTGWIWNATVDACLICQGMNGSLHPLDDDMYSHPNCRCSADPTTAPLDTLQLAEQTGDIQAFYENAGAMPFNANDRFATIPPAMQRRILGPTRHHAWKQGVLDIRAIPKKVTHPTWGPGLRAKTLAELGLTKGNYPKTAFLDDLAASVPPKPMTPPPSVPQPPLPGKVENADGTVTFNVGSTAPAPPKPAPAPPPPAPTHPASAPPAKPPAPLIEWEGELRFHRDLTGSSHGGKVLKDAAGTRYAWKPARGDKWIAEAENAAAQLAHRLGIPVPKSRMITFEGEYGQIQEYLQGATTYVQSPYVAASAADEVAEVIRHHVFDWLIGNHDTHKDNFLMHGGKLWGIDKGQSWKFIRNDRLDTSWKPPGNHGENIYRKFWDDFAAGRNGYDAVGIPEDLDAIPDDLLMRIASMPDDEFRTLVDPYVSALPVSPAQRAEIATAMLARKASITRQWEDFVSEKVAARRIAIGKAKRDAKNRPTYFPVNTDNVDGYTPAAKIVSRFLGWWKNRPKAHVTAVQRYTGSAYDNMNTKARRVMQGLDTDTDDMKRLDKLLAAAPAPGEKWWTWRGWKSRMETALGLPDDGLSFSGLDDFERLINHQFQEGGWVSSSHDGYQAQRWGHERSFVGTGKSYMLTARLRHGAKRKIAPIQEISRFSSEYEVLIPRASRFKVVGVTVSGPKAEVDALFQSVRGSYDWLRRDDGLLGRNGGSSNTLTIVLEIDVR